MLNLLLATLAAAAQPSCTTLDEAVAEVLVAGGCRTLQLERLRWAHRMNPCLEQVLADHGLGVSAAVLPPPPTAPDGGKASRSGYSPLRDFSHETPNFVVRWGDPELPEADVVLLGELLEEAWSVQISTHDWALPLGASQYKINAYVDGTNAGPPDTSDHVAAYYSLDPLGQPMIVVGRDQLSRSSLAGTLQHEFHHAVQGGYATLEYTDTAAWWFEASATWMESIADPEDDEHMRSLGAFARHPHLPLGFYVDIAEGLPLESYAYGAFVFPRYLELIGGQGLVRSVWEEARSAGNPLRTLDGLLEEDGIATTEWFGEFVLRNATWDYPERRRYQSAVRDYDEADGTWPSGAVAVPTTEPVSPVEALPATFGVNYWEVVQPPPTFQVEFQGAGGPAEWVVGVVGLFGKEQQRVLVSTGGDGSAVVPVEGMDTADEVWVVIAAVDGYVDDGAEFDYSFTTGPLVLEEEVLEEPPQACGCSTGRGVEGWLALLGAFAVRRRLGGREQTGARRR